MSELYNVNLQAKLAQFCKDVGGQNKAASAVGLSSSIISQYLRGIYHDNKGDVAKTEQTLTEFFRVLDERNEQPVRQAAVLDEGFGYVPTTISEHIYKTIRYCQLEKSISMIYGDAGIGKTMGALKFVRDFPTTAIYIRVNPANGVMSRFVRKLADKLRIPPNRDIGVLVDAIADKLVGTNKVLIVDEGQNLHFRTMELLRDWVDADPDTGRQGVSIVLIGNKKMYTRMQGRLQEDFAQQFNRSRPQPVSTRMCTREDVAKVFPQLEQQGKEKELDFLFSVCRSRWALRNAAFIYTDAVNSNDLSVERLRGIAQNRGIAIA